MICILAALFVLSFVVPEVLAVIAERRWRRRRRTRRDEGEDSNRLYGDSAHPDYDEDDDEDDE